MDRFTSRSSSGHSLSGHTPPDTTVANSSAPSRFVYPPFVRTSRCREAYRRWRTAPLSTMYLLTTSESSIGDSSSESSAGPSHKRCRSPANSVPSSTPVSGSLAPTRADLLPPRKRFRDSYSSEASMEEDTEVGTAEAKVGMELGSGDGIDSRDRIETNPRDVREDREEYEAETSAGDTVELGIDPVSALIVDEEIVEPVGNDSSDSSGTRDGIVRSFEDMPINLDDVLKADQLIANGERASMVERIKSLRLVNIKVQALLGVERDRVDSLRMTPEAIEELVNRRVEEALTAYEAPMLSRLKTKAKMTVMATMEMVEMEMGTKGVVGLIRWFEKMETVFHISNCPEKSQVKYATCTLLDGALTWWNSHKRTIRTEAAFAMSWRELMKQMTEVYCPRNEIQKIEAELWNLTVKNNDLTAYT
ncbi:reverse transcriptase domain-containing protein [Tanacetum coccineum]